MRTHDLCNEIDIYMGTPNATNTLTSLGNGLYFEPSQNSFETGTTMVLKDGKE